MEKQMDVIEYPKMLYRDGEHRIVDDAEQEAAARAERYDNWADDQARLNTPADEHTQARKPRAAKG